MWGGSSQQRNKLETFCIHFYCPLTSVCTVVIDSRLRYSWRNSCLRVSFSFDYLKICTIVKMGVTWCWITFVLLSILRIPFFVWVSPQHWYSHYLHHLLHFVSVLSFLWFSRHVMLTAMTTSSACVMRYACVPSLTNYWNMRRRRDCPLISAVFICAKLNTSTTSMSLVLRGRLWLVLVSVLLRALNQVCRHML